MKNKILSIVALLSCIFSFSSFSQNSVEPESLGLPGDNLNLYAVLDIFQKAETIESFEKSLNQADTKINNLDLDNNGKVDFIKVTTKKEGENFMFILQDEVGKNETQDVAVIFVNKDRNKKVSIQVVGDENLYGKDYVVEPIVSSTANPGYKGNSTGTAISVNVVNVARSPVVIYLYSPVYVPYYSRYYYGYYPRYYRPWAPLFFSVYYRYHYHYHNRYYRPYYHRYPAYYSRYYSGRRTSVIVINNTRNGIYRRTYNGNNYKKPASPTTRPSTITRPTSPSTRPTSPSTTRPTTPSTRPTSPSTTRPTTPSTTRPTAPSTRPTSPSITRPTAPSTRPVTRPTSPSARP
ncbi:hypothetical protein [Flavobacterium praedii]|uniref:hypothetical protein n=1 Tax=Flavobacterium praedii TaxID=3002900 RepID=UPI0024819FE5|nr:hypothetical protein [Flavobacterium praedii]